MPTTQLSIHQPAMCWLSGPLLNLLQTFGVMRFQKPTPRKYGFMMDEMHNFKLKLKPFNLQP
jgi:hypothetical protein